MKLVRFGNPGVERPGLIDAGGSIRDLSGVIADVGGDALLPDGQERLQRLDPESLPVVEGAPRVGPCVAGVGKFICIGLNYRDHARESGMEIPAEPLVFMKATSAICGPNDDVELPPGSAKSDWEVELGVIIGAPAKRVEEAHALEHVAGYCVVNDLSEREYQMERGGQWVKGKSWDTFGPIGPWLVSRDEVPDPQNVSMWLEVDGQRRQDGHSRDMVFGVSHLVSYLSEFMTLQTGDIISTGTPAGVALGMNPPAYLKPGQVMRLSVEGLGSQQQHVVGG